jgi:hypothetical protein
MTGSDFFCVELASLHYSVSRRLFVCVAMPSSIRAFKKLFHCARTFGRLGMSAECAHAPQRVLP